jgi:glutamate-1-semialdehyde aminotransferase
MVRFFKGGAESNAAAVRIARAVTGREKVASCGYRGWHDQWAIANEATKEGIPAVLREYTLPFQYGDLASLQAVFEQHPRQIAAVILEPATVDGADVEFLHQLRKLTSAEDTLLIFDEVVTGFRLALGGAQSFLGVVPDMAVFAKALANGMPLAAVAGTRAVMQAAERLFITLTYGDESLSLAAAIASLQVMRQQEVHRHLWAVGERLMQGLSAAADRARLPFTNKGLAPMWRLALDNGAFARWEVRSEQVWVYVLQEMARRGVLWRPGGIFLISYSHSEEDVDYTIRMAGEVFAYLREALDAGDLPARLALGCSQRMNTA